MRSAHQSLERLDLATIPGELETAIEGGILLPGGLADDIKHVLDAGPASIDRERYQRLLAVVSGDGDPCSP